MGAIRYLPYSSLDKLFYLTLKQLVKNVHNFTSFTNTQGLSRMTLDLQVLNSSQKTLTKSLKNFQPNYFLFFCEKINICSLERIDRTMDRTI